MKLGNVITIIVIFMIVMSMLIPIGMQFLTVEPDYCEEINYYVPSVSVPIKVGMGNIEDTSLIDVNSDHYVPHAVEENGE